MTWVFVGLGNPGPEYAGTRHNLGAVCIERLARRWGVALQDRRRLCVLGETRRRGEDVVLARPRTYVNASGEAVRYLVDRFRIPPCRLLVVYDDVDIPPGRIRLRPKGSSGGHNGLKSIIHALGTEEFPRLRIGVGRPPPGMARADYVLSPPLAEDAEAIDEALERACDALEAVVEEGLDLAMTRFNV